MRDALPDDLARRVRALPFGRLFETRTGHVVVGQRPNAPLYAMVALLGVGLVLKGAAGGAALLGAALACFVWAVLEIGWGVNPFRRILGVLGLVVLAAIALHGRGVAL